MSNVGTLFIVATPIGNLSDITLRALETLKDVDLIAAEDTRHSSKLLKHYNIKTPAISLHNYNETKRSQFILQQLQQGKNIALITDAGTPLISDPGYHLVKTIQENGLQVIPIPGACAAIAALSTCGLATNKFIFEGFLPAKSKQQLQRLQELMDKTETIIFYESPHRLLMTINNMLTVFGHDRYIVIAKELTKTFETIYGNTIFEVQNWLIEKPERQKGEFVILVKGTSKEAIINPEVLRILELLSKNMSHKQAVALTSEITGVNKNQLYKIFCPGPGCSDKSS
ncbi:MAG: 16S rRNA (cytidine(1402)-2'-O)-methyltransferase [Gammaproteobacteria bacterium RBG_16_37_9]|nr:MAG: 16S rRNA (cytidine(1402)-2'-O)-methyltransferase [Gammaproteobacteria bacterium RBG_16_37_9]